MLWESDGYRSIYIVEMLDEVDDTSDSLFKKHLLFEFLDELGVLQYNRSNLPMSHWSEWIITIKKRHSRS